MFCHVCSSSPLTQQLKCHPPLRCQTKPDPRELFALTDFSGRLMFQVWGHILFSTRELFNLNYSSAKAAVPQV